jgi:H+/gluconate symporter-like permease
MLFVVVFAAGLAADVVVLGVVALELFLLLPPHPAASAAMQRASATDPKIFVGSFMAIPSFALAGPPANPDICGDEIVAAGT